MTQCGPPEWEQHRRELEELYVSRGWTLPAIQNHMTRRHGFDASRDMYKRRFKQWGLRKNKKEDEMKAANWRRQQPDRIGKPTAVRIRGNLYYDSDLDSYFKRRSKHTRRPPSPLSRPAEDVLAQMTCSTPRPGESPPALVLGSSPEAIESTDSSSRKSSSSSSRIAPSLARLEPARPASAALRVALWPEIGLMSKSSSPERPISTPDPWKYQEPALIEISKLFDIALQADPERMASKFSDPTSDPRLHSLISAMHHFDIGNTYNALVHLKQSCAVLETSAEPLDLNLMVDLTSSPSIFGDHRQRSSPTTTLGQHRSSLIVFMKHLQDVSSLQLGREHPIFLLSEWLRKTESWMDLCYRICELVTGRLIDILGPYHVASIKMRRRIARFPMYAGQNPKLDLVDDSLTILLEDCRTQLPERHPAIRHIKMELGFVLYMKGDWQRIIDLYQENLAILFNPPLPPHHRRVSPSPGSSPILSPPISSTAAFFSQPKMVCYEVLQTTNLVAQAQEYLQLEYEAEATLRRIVTLCHEEFLGIPSYPYDIHSNIDPALISSSTPPPLAHHFIHSPSFSTHSPFPTTSLPSSSSFHAPYTTSCPTPSQTEPTSHPDPIHTKHSTRIYNYSSSNQNTFRAGTTLWHTITFDVTKRLVQFLERRGRDNEADSYYRLFLESKEEESRGIWVEGK